MNMFLKFLTTSLFITCFQFISEARMIYVFQEAYNASDSNPGTFALPLSTIQAGADMAQAGDTILVKGGIYREKVIPRRSGLKDRPITYLAAPGENVSIRGSEHIIGWKDQGEGLWKANIDNRLFGKFNPFELNVTGCWLLGNGTRSTQNKHHLGDVYYNGEAYREVFSADLCKSREKTWYSEQADGETLIYANFGDGDPNKSLTEINVRSSIIFPETSGLKYIIIDGFDIRHAASQWSDTYHLEEGAVGMKYGYRWTIQNCTISDCRNNGISMGVSDELPFPDTLSEGGKNIPEYGTFGFHTIRNNIIRRCGQCAIYGCYGAVGSTIENNQITETLYRREWIGPNQADIKILFPIDVTIRNNKFYGKSGTQKAVWLDWGSQNARITGNLIIDRREGVFTEVSFGPTIIDNNLFIRSGIKDWSDGNVYAHNLFYETPQFEIKSEPKRAFVPYYHAHSTVLAGRNWTNQRHERWYNNLFIGKKIKEETISIDKAFQFIADYNMFYKDAPQFSCEGKHSKTTDRKNVFVFYNEEGRDRILFNADMILFNGKLPYVTSKLVGKMPLSGIYMEDKNGQPISISKDYFGKDFNEKSVLPGPFQNIKPGINQLDVWPK